ncbi:hypothetical protein GH714_006030 [Hevea brasiliensis]|uniref:Uncharacterized protein n=1 Tax=Hevea brasiliensis TaxID=3981 RepID=A0A6A6KZK7_HEVBR|nr:hypothetical protein GH714_006030 [Hevea brasiliensis]
MISQRQAQARGEARGFDPVCSPYTGVELRHHQTMSLDKAAVPFREIGLRHFCVDPKAPGTDSITVFDSKTIII